MSDNGGTDLLPGKAVFIAGLVDQTATCDLIHQVCAREQADLKAQQVRKPSRKQECSRQSRQNQRRPSNISTTTMINMVPMAPTPP
jgi:hypothetical protein